MFQHVPTALWEGTSAMIWVKLLLNICRKHSDKFMMLESDQAQGLIPDVVSLGACLERCGHLGWPQTLIHGIPMCSMHFPREIQVVFVMFVVQSVFAFPVVSGQGIQVGKGSLQPLDDFGSLNLVWYVGTGKSILSAPGPYRSILCGDKNSVALIIAPLDVGSGLSADLLVIISQKVWNIFFILPNFLGPSLVIVSYITFFPVVPKDHVLLRCPKSQW